MASKVPLPHGARRIAPSPSLMTVVDSTTKPLWSFYGSEEFVTEEARKYLDRQDATKVAAGDFGLDYSEHCTGCNDYHSPEADCE